jgi:hypothetical protein
MENFSKTRILIRNSLNREFALLCCAKFVLKIYTMDRILQNQWNV